MYTFELTDTSFLKALFNNDYSQVIVKTSIQTFYLRIPLPYKKFWLNDTKRNQSISFGKIVDKPSVFAMLFQIRKISVDFTPNQKLLISRRSNNMNSNTTCSGHFRRIRFRRKLKTLHQQNKRKAKLPVIKTKIKLNKFTN